MESQILRHFWFWQNFRLWEKNWSKFSKFMSQCNFFVFSSPGALSLCGFCGFFGLVNALDPQFFGTASPVLSWRECWQSRRFFSGFRWNAKPGPLTKNLETLCFFNHSKLLKRLKCSGQHRNRKVDSPSNQNQNEIQSVLIFLSDRFQISQTWKMEDGWRNVWSMPHDQCDTGGRDWSSWPNLMFLLQSTGRRRDYHGW